MVAVIAEVNDPLSRDELVEAIAHLCADVKALSRRGYVGTRCKRYERLHQEINARLVQLEVYGAE